MRFNLRHISTLAIMALGLSASAQFARVQLIHNSADAGAAVVDIYVNNTLAIDDFGFREATPFIDLPAGFPITAGVAPGNSMGPADIIASFPLGSLTSGETYVIMATGLLDAMAYNPFEAFTLNVFPLGQESAMQAGNTDVLVYHGATDAPAVDVIEVGVGAGQIIDGMAYGDFAGGAYLELPTLDFILDITLDNGTPTGLQYEAPLATLGLDGAALVVFASGFLNPANNNDGEAFGLWVALPDGTTLPLPEWNPTANVQVIHNSADALAAEVDVYLNGELAIDNFAFRTATPFLQLPAYDLLQVGIAPGNSDGAEDIIATFDYNLGADESYIVVASGLLDDVNYSPYIPFDLKVFAQGQTESGNNTETDILAFHGSTDAPAVDLFEVGIGAGQLADDLAFGDFGGYLELATDDYYVQIRLSDGVTPVVTYQAPLETLSLEGVSGVAFASGFLDPANNNDGAAFGLFVAFPDGTVVPLPALGNAPENNVCAEASPITVGAECADNTVTGTLENAWNDYGVPVCELPGLLPNVYYSFNSGNWGVITVDISALEGSGPEVGMLILGECGEVAEEVDLDGAPNSDPCVYNASLTGAIDLVGFAPNTEYTLMVFSNLDFGNVTGEFELCISGSEPSIIFENEPGTFTVYPNPSKGTFSIDFSGANGNATLDIIDLSGKLVWSGTKNMANGSRIDVSTALSSGLYLARLQDAEGSVRTARLIIE